MIYYADVIFKGYSLYRHKEYEFHIVIDKILILTVLWYFTLLLSETFLSQQPQ